MYAVGWWHLHLCSHCATATTNYSWPSFPRQTPSTSYPHLLPAFSNPPSDVLALRVLASTMRPPAGLLGPPHSVRRRLARVVRTILGPAKPTPNDELPRPSPSVSLSCVLPRTSYRLSTDTPIYNLSRRYHLRYLLIPTLLLWCTANILLIRQQYFFPSSPEIADCTSALWNDWPPDTCGVNATACAPELVSQEVRCLGGCGEATLGNPRWVGDVKVNGVPLLIGGGDESGVYR
jgi:hypothetical protein